MWDLYKRTPSLMLGFHGCDRSVGEAILAGKSTLRASNNNYDWLGPGIYFWEGNPSRALAFATQAAKQNPNISQGEIKDPFVVGAIIDVGYCCNLQDSEALAELRETYPLVRAASENSGTPLPVNKGGRDQLKRHLDCAVITLMHSIRAAKRLEPYQSVRGAFWEGEELYPGATLTAQQHGQIAVIDPTCIKGYFRPLEGSGPTPTPKRRRKTKDS